MAAEYDYEWNQGEDLTVSLVYKSGPVGDEDPVDLTNYALRMDIASPNGQILTVLNDEAIADTDAEMVGSQADSNYEVTLGSDGAISIQLSRALTLYGGPFYALVNASSAGVDFPYDVFLRDKTVNRQTKILFGKITVVKSITKWL